MTHRKTFAMLIFACRCGIERILDENFDNHDVWEDELDNTSHAGRREEPVNLETATPVQSLTVVPHLEHLER